MMSGTIGFTPCYSAIHVMLYALNLVGFHGGFFLLVLVLCLIGGAVHVNVGCKFGFTEIWSAGIFVDQLLPFLVYCLLWPSDGTPPWSRARSFRASVVLWYSRHYCYSCVLMCAVFPVAV